MLMCFTTIRHGKRRGETLKLPRLKELQGFGQRIGSCNVSSRSRFGQNFERLGLISVSKTWVSGLVSVSAQKVSCTSLRDSRLIHVASCFRLLTR